MPLSSHDFYASIRSTANRCWSWIWSLDERESKTTGVAETLERSMRVTAKCRYNAADRIVNRSRFGFFTSIILSLGLIFIPLMQNTGIPLAFRSSVLNMIQIFLAVSVLVLSVVFGSARYDVRATKLTDCGDRLKQIIRGIRRQRASGNSLSNETLIEYENQYADVVRDCENHVRSDYNLAILEMRHEFYWTGIPRMKLWLSARLGRITFYVIPLCLLCFELLFITDMIHVTHVFTEFFSKSS